MDLVAASVVITQALAAAQVALYSITAIANLSEEELKEFEQCVQLGDVAVKTYGSAGKRIKDKAAAGPNIGEKQEALTTGRTPVAKKTQKRSLEASREKTPKRKRLKGTPKRSRPLVQQQQRTTAGSESAIAASPAPTLTGRGRRLWSAEETEHLIQLVENDAYRQQHLGLSRADFRAIGAHLGRGDQAARSKYSYYLKVEKGLLPDQRPREPSVRRSISYGWMAVHGLGQLPGMEGTGEQILQVIEAHPPFQPLLDCSVRADSAGVARWKQRVREELSHRHCFINTGRKEGGETVWRLNKADQQLLPSKQPPKDLLPFLGKHGKCNG
ncbi:hypothetical protein N2152v2_001564 [Parachlorella kessleri]